MGQFSLSVPTSCILSPSPKSRKWFRWIRCSQSKKMKQRNIVILLVIMKLLGINAMMEGCLVDVDIIS